VSVGRPLVVRQGGGGAGSGGALPASERPAAFALGVPVGVLLVFDQFGGDLT
jgi:hypothetical protein